MMFEAAALCTLTVALGAVVLARRLFLIIKRSGVDLRLTSFVGMETLMKRKTCSVATLTIKQASATINCHARCWRAD